MLARHELLRSGWRGAKKHSCIVFTQRRTSPIIVREPTKFEEEDGSDLTCRSGVGRRTDLTIEKVTG
jgi:hypothetical protein